MNCSGDTLPLLVNLIISVSNVLLLTVNPKNEKIVMKLVGQAKKMRKSYLCLNIHSLGLSLLLIVKLITFIPNRLHTVLNYK